MLCVIVPKEARRFVLPVKRSFSKQFHPSQGSNEFFIAKRSRKIIQEMQIYSLINSFVKANRNKRAKKIG